MNRKLDIMPLDEAIKVIQGLITDPLVQVKDIVTDLEVFEGSDINELIIQAMSGVPGAAERMQRVIVSIMGNNDIAVDGMDRKEAALEIYKRLWGLDVIEDLYNDPEVDEIRVNGPDKVYIQKKGRNEATDIKFEDDDHIMKIISRMIVDDRVSLNRSNPKIESRRADGSRLTALCPPIVPHPSFVLRKHGTFKADDENYVESGTMDEYTKILLKTLAKGRANILISGGVDSGKTTLLRWMVNSHNPKIRIITLETDFELYLNKWYPNRDIVAMEEQPDLGVTIRDLFITALRYTPDVVIVGEARGKGEAGQMIQACIRGYSGSMGTVHASSPDEAVFALAQMAIEEGSALPIDMILGQISRAFNIVVHMFGDNVTGRRMVEEIDEIIPSHNGYKLNPLVKWITTGDAYIEGHWEHMNQVSEPLRRKMFKYGVSQEEIDRICNY